MPTEKAPVHTIDLACRKSLKKKKHDGLHVELPPILSVMPIHKLMIQNPLIDSTIMGNCMDVLMHRPKEKIRVLMSDGGEEFNAWAPAEKIIRSPYNGLKLVHHSEPRSPLLPNTRLEPGDVFYLLSLQAQPHCPPIPSRTANPKTGKRRKVKIVVTEEQLELLLRTTQKFKSKGIALHCLKNLRVEGCQKWQPSLATIPEAYSFGVTG